MLQQAETLVALPPSGLTEVALRDMPPGGRSYSFVSTMSGNGMCTRSVEITATGNGPPRIVSHSSGDCGAMTGPAGSVALPTAPAPAGQPRLLEARVEGAQPYAGLVRPAVAWQR